MAYELTLGKTLTMRLTVANDGDQPVHFEEALHTYLHIGNPEHIRILGLANTEYLDKVDGFKRKRQTEQALTLSGTTDRPYLNTAATVMLDDPDLHRRITVAKKNSRDDRDLEPVGRRGPPRFRTWGPDDWPQLHLH